MARPPGSEIHLAGGQGAFLRKIQRDVETLKRAQGGPVRTSRVVITDSQGNERQVFGTQPDGSVAARAIGGATPPVPDLPDVIILPNALRVANRGAPQSGGYWPADVEIIEVHVSQTPNFAPTDATRAAVIGTLPQGTTISVALGTWYVVLVAVSTSGVRSAPSIQVQRGVRAADLVSENYDTSSAGAKVDTIEGNAEFTYMQVNKALNATTVAATDVLVKGQSVGAYLARPDAGTIVAQGTIDSLSIQGRTSETGIADVVFTALPGRCYRVDIDGPEYASSDFNTNIIFRVRFSRNGEAPTVTSPVLRHLGVERGGFDAPAMYRNFFFWYSDVAAPTTIRLLLTFARYSGQDPTTVGVNTTNGRVLQMFVSDVGPQLPNGVTANVSSAVNPPPPPPPAKQRYGPTFFPSSGAVSYYGGANGAVRSFNGENLWQGQAPGNAGGNGNQHSMLFFNIAALRQQIPANATVISAELAIKCKSTYAFAGGSIFVGSHGNDGAPNNWPSGDPNLKPNRSGAIPVSGNNWKGIDVTGIVTEMKNSQASGFTIGEAPNTDPNNYAIFYAPASGQVPGVNITWEV